MMDDGRLTADPAMGSALALKGSNYAGLLERHRIHTKNVEHVVDSLRNERIEVRLVKRREYNEETVRWADAVISAGGDGTMLLAASKVFDKFKPVIGINTDPERSEGHLCLPVRYTHSFPEALQKLYRGEFRWQWRQRIRLYLEGTGINTTPVDLHEQQLSQEQHSRAHINERFQDQITNDYNESLLYSPEEPKMFFSVREPIVNRVFSSSRQRGFSSKTQTRVTVPDSASRSSHGRRTITKSFSLSFTFCRFGGRHGEDTSRSCGVFSLRSLSFLRADTPMPERSSEVLPESHSKLVETLVLEDGISWRCFLQTQQNPEALRVLPD
ncbi:hypothetical protein IHE44_0011622 [Lamprotornis superbus]|uniref:NAD(+) kinase n=1 Tax=Lamprotornis superbus TaxID=245042 RepID=A0A835NG71_9PASS|nr:hypothetical protein IHE44_0011622 [Lamprotornis superbus]